MAIMTIRTELSLPRTRRRRRIHCLHLVLAQQILLCLLYHPSSSVSSAAFHPQHHRKIRQTTNRHHRHFYQNEDHNDDNGVAYCATTKPESINLHRLQRFHLTPFVTTSGETTSRSPLHLLPAEKTRAQEAAAEESVAEAPDQVNNALDRTFGSFVSFTVLQTAVARIAQSQSMMADSQAMMVDCVTYLLNTCAQRWKTGRNNGNDEDSHQTLFKLGVEWMAPLVGVTCLLGITLVSLHDAVQILHPTLAYYPATTIGNTLPEQTPPSVHLMMLFSILNLGLDVLNGNHLEQAAATSTTTTAITSTPVDPISSGHNYFWQQPLVIIQEDDDVLSEEDLLFGCGGRGFPVPRQPTPTSLVALSMVATTTAAECEPPQEEQENLNMSSVQLHVFADTLRSITVLLSASVATWFPHHISPQQADAWGGVCVSLVILVSILPLLEALVKKTLELHDHVMVVASNETKNKLE